jgi:flagellar biosynthesis/type III secretory pathway protein FliH
MTVDTYVGQARTRVRAEQGAIDAKRDAFETFVQRVREIPTHQNSAPPVGVTTVAGTQHRSNQTTDGGCRKVLAAFAETIRSHSVEDFDTDEPLLETVRAEFTESIAVTLAPTTEAPLTPELKEMIVTEAETRRAEAIAFDRALDRETKQLADADDVVEEITGWIIRSEEPPLSAIGFNALKLRHETLDRHRSRCETLAQRRQEFLEETTSNGTKAGVRHRQLMPYLYDELSVDYPVLATVAQLDAACREYQRAVRDQLTRRG